MARKRLNINATSIRINAYCGGCKQPFVLYELDTEIEGGCQGHGSEEYCYCSPAEVLINIECPRCNNWNQFRADDL